ncbi:MAG: ABC transporter ATP-binding protein [Candidatus Hydrogenedentes bacterium]|nr:ABC transporter ATP-binding protein [Candidatus Hydrogenedentota bacterium]
MNAEASADNIIEVRDLVVQYGDHTVINEISFNVRRGEIFVILGGSGCGKSTLLRNLVGLMKPSKGTIAINGEDFTAMKDSERSLVRKHMGMCFQGSALFNSMTVGDNVALPLREHTQLEESTIEIMTRIKLELVGLGEFADYLPSELSGGMKKRAGLARAMAMDPEIIFYDEPSAGLDPIVAAGLDELIRQMQNTFNVTSIVVTHELESVKMIADRVCMLEKGHIIGIGSLEEIRNIDHPYVKRFFARKSQPESASDNTYFQTMTGETKTT